MIEEQGPGASQKAEKKISICPDVGRQTRWYFEKTTLSAARR